MFRDKIERVKLLSQDKNLDVAYQLAYSSSKNVVFFCCYRTCSCNAVFQGWDS